MSTHANASSERTRAGSASPTAGPRTRTDTLGRTKTTGRTPQGPYPQEKLARMGRRAIREEQARIHQQTFHLADELARHADLSPARRAALISRLDTNQARYQQLQQRLAQLDPRVRAALEEEARRAPIPARSTQWWQRAEPQALVREAERLYRQAGQARTQARSGTAATRPGGTRSRGSATTRSDASPRHALEHPAVSARRMALGARLTRGQAGLAQRLFTPEGLERHAIHAARYALVLRAYRILKVALRRFL